MTAAAAAYASSSSPSPKHIPKTLSRHAHSTTTEKKENEKEREKGRDKQKERHPSSSASARPPVRRSGLFSAPQLARVLVLVLHERAPDVAYIDALMMMHGQAREPGGAERDRVRVHWGRADQVHRELRVARRTWTLLAAATPSASAPEAAAPARAADGTSGLATATTVTTVAVATDVIAATAAATTSAATHLPRPRMPALGRGSPFRLRISRSSPASASPAHAISRRESDAALPRCTPEPHHGPPRQTRRPCRPGRASFGGATGRADSGAAGASAGLDRW